MRHVYTKAQRAALRSVDIRVGDYDETRWGKPTGKHLWTVSYYPPHSVIGRRVATCESEAEAQRVAQAMRIMGDELSKETEEW